MIQAVRGIKNELEGWMRAPQKREDVLYSLFERTVCLTQDPHCELSCELSDLMDEFTKTPLLTSCARRLECEVQQRLSGKVSTCSFLFLTQPQHIKEILEEGELASKIPNQQEPCLLSYDELLGDLDTDREKAGAILAEAFACLEGRKMDPDFSFLNRETPEDVAFLFALLKHFRLNAFQDRLLQSFPNHFPEIPQAIIYLDTTNWGGWGDLPDSQEDYLTISVSMISQEKQKKCQEILSLMTKRYYEEERDDVRRSLGFLTNYVLGILLELHSIKKKSLPPVSLSLRNAIIKTRIFKQNLSPICMEIIKRYVEQVVDKDLSLGQINRCVFSIDERLKEEFSKILRRYPSFCLMPQIYSTAPDAQILSKNASDQSIANTVEAMKLAIRDQTLPDLFDKLLVALGHARFVLAKQQQTKDYQTFGVRRYTSYLKTALGPIGQYGEYYLCSMINYCDKEKTKKNIIRDVEVKGYRHSLCIYPTIKEFAAKDPHEYQKLEDEFDLKNLKREVILVETLEKDGRSITLSRYQINEACGIPIFSIIHQNPLDSTAMMPWLRESFERCFSSNLTEDELKCLVGVFRYLFAHACPYKRGSAMIGEWIEKAIYQFHGYDFTYTYETPTQKGSPLADLDAFSSFGLLAFLELYLEKARLVPVFPSGDQKPAADPHFLSSDDYQDGYDYFDFAGDRVSSVDEPILERMTSIFSAINRIQDIKERHRALERFVLDLFSVLTLNPEDMLLAKNVFSQLSEPSIQDLFLRELQNLGAKASPLDQFLVLAFQGQYERAEEWVAQMQSEEDKEFALALLPMASTKHRLEANSLSKSGSSTKKSKTAVGEGKKRPR